MKWFISLVLPGFEDVRASFFWLHNMLIRDDLPTFERPIKANSGNLGEGLSLIFVLLPENMA